MSVRPHVKRGGLMRFCWLIFVVVSSLIFRISSTSEPVNTGLYLPGLKSLPRLGRRSGGDISPAQQQHSKEMWNEPYNLHSTFPNRHSILFHRYGVDPPGISKSYFSGNEGLYPRNGIGIFSYPQFLFWKKIFSGSANGLRMPIMASASENGLLDGDHLEDENGFVNLRDRL